MTPISSFASPLFYRGLLFAFFFLRVCGIDTIEHYLIAQSSAQTIEKISELSGLSEEDRQALSSQKGENDKDEKRESKILRGSSGTTVHGALKAYTPEQVPNVQLQDAQLFVSDPENLINANEKRQINSLLNQIRTTYGVEGVVIILPSIGEQRSVEEFGLKILRLWGVGDKEKQDGFVILAVLDQSAIRMEIGYGLEWLLTDAECIKIINREMAPVFRKGAYGIGFIRGIESIGRVLEESGYSRHQGARRLGPSEGGISFSDVVRLYFFVMLFFGLILLLRIFFIAKEGKGAYKLAPQERLWALQELKKSILGYTILMPPIGFLVWFTYIAQCKTLQKKVQICPHCLSANSFHPLSEEALLSKLPPIRQAEFKAGSIRYKAYGCTRCRHEALYHYALSNKKVERCPRCRAKAFVLMRAQRIPESGGTRIRQVWSCLHCQHTTEKEIVDPTVSFIGDILNILLMAIFSGASGGGRGGGRSGGGFGGGSGGGGGATGRF